MEQVEDIVIVGAGICGLATSLGLYRLGLRSLVLESSDSLRVTGFAYTSWTNAWRALDALGIGESIRQQHLLIERLIVTSTVSDQAPVETSLRSKGKHGDSEVRGVKRKVLLEELAGELPNGTIRFSSKVVFIDESGYFKLVHLADGTVIKTKVLIGCDGVNSVVAKWLGLKTPCFAGRSSIRGYADFKDSHHGLRPEFLQFVGKGMRSGFLPCDDHTVYWFITGFLSGQDEETENNPAKLKQYVLEKCDHLPDNVKRILQNTPTDSIISSPLRYRCPWELLWGSGHISKGNVCVAGDAFHPMTPDIGQGGCSALEDSVVLARCIVEALEGTDDDNDGVVFRRLEMALRKYANERKWRSFELISRAYVVGYIQLSEWKIMTILRDKFLGNYLAGLLIKSSDFDCGKLN